MTWTAQWKYIGLFNVVFGKNFPSGSDGKVSVYNVGDLGSIPGSGRSPGEGNGNPLQYYWPGKIPWTEELGRLQSVGSQRVGHDWATSLSLWQKQYYSFSDNYLPQGNAKQVYTTGYRCYTEPASPALEQSDAPLLLHHNSW